MKVINDSPNGETKDTDVIEFMEEKYPGASHRPLPRYYLICRDLSPALELT